MPVIDTDIIIARTSDNFKFSAAVAGFGMLLRDSEYKNDLNYKDIIALAKNSKGNDQDGYRSEFLEIVKAADLLRR